MEEVAISSLRSVYYFCFIVTFQANFYSIIVVSRIHSNDENFIPMLMQFLEYYSSIEFLNSSISTPIEA